MKTPSKAGFEGGVVLGQGLITWKYTPRQLLQTVLQGTLEGGQYSGRQRKC